MLVILGRHRFDLLTSVPRRPSHRCPPGWWQRGARGERRRLATGRRSPIQSLERRISTAVRKFVESIIDIAASCVFSGPARARGRGRRDGKCRGRQREFPFICARKCLSSVRCPSLPDSSAARLALFPAHFITHRRRWMCCRFIPLSAADVLPLQTGRRRRCCCSCCAPASLQLWPPAFIDHEPHSSSSSTPRRCRCPSAVRFAVSRVIETPAQRGINSGRTRDGSN